MHSGWAFTMLAFLNLAFAPLILIEWRMGMRFRGERAARLAEKDVLDGEGGKS